MEGRPGCLADSKQATTTLRLQATSLGRKIKAAQPHEAARFSNSCEHRPSCGLPGHCRSSFARVLQTGTISLQHQPRTQHLLASLRSQLALVTKQGLTHTNCARAPHKLSISKSRLLLLVRSRIRKTCLMGASRRHLEKHNHAPVPFVAAMAYHLAKRPLPLLV